MSRPRSLPVVAMLLVAGCSQNSSTTSTVRPQPTATRGASPPTLVVGEPIRYENLTIFPVTSPEARSDDRFITLDEGLRAGTVEIFEVGAYPGRAAREPQSDVRPTAPVNVGESDDSGDDPFGDADEEGLFGPVAGVDVSPRPATDAREETPGAGDAHPAAENPPQPVNSSADAATATPVQEAANSGGDPFDDASSEGGLFDDANAADNPFGGGNRVNTLLVRNKSDRPLYLMPGEIVVGGSQDRTIGNEIVIQPNTEPVPIDVFCVEHGR